MSVYYFGYPAKPEKIPGEYNRETFENPTEFSPIYGTVYAYGVIWTEIELSLEDIAANRLIPADPVEYSRDVFSRAFGADAESAYNEISRAIGEGNFEDIRKKYSKDYINAVQIRLYGEFSRSTTSDFCEVLAELAKGYDYNRRYRNEPLAGIYWSNEGFYNFALRVIHTVTGFDNSKTRIGSYGNVLSQMEPGGRNFPY